MAVSAPVPTFVAIGARAWGPVQELRGRPELRLVPTPRHASVLLVVGAVPSDHREALDRVHDQVPHPRAVVGWPGTELRPHGLDRIVDDVVEAHRHITVTPGESSPDRLPDQEPNEWRGVGPHGQGGEGMMGGTPYGRPMAMTGADRDGLTLDRLQVPLGPFLEVVPPGVVLDTTLQGEVVQALRPRLAAPGGEAMGADPTASDATVGPARARLRWLAHGLHVHGLDALATRAARLAARVDEPGATDAFRRLRRFVVRSGLLWSVRGVGVVDDMGDSADRWRLRLDEIAAALAGEPVDEHRPRLAWDALADALVGLTLTDAITTLTSVVDRIVTPTEALAP